MCLIAREVLALFSFGMVEFFFPKKDGLSVHLSCIPKVLRCFISSISLNLEVYLRASTRAWSIATSPEDFFVSGGMQGPRHTQIGHFVSHAQTVAREASVQPSGSPRKTYGLQWTSWCTSWNSFVTSHVSTHGFVQSDCCT